MSAAGDRHLGRYRLESLIGRGGMAEVWRAVDTKLGRTVAVKVIHAAYAEDRSFVERFLREARLVASVEHPNILPVYDVGEEAGLPFLVMPYLEGGTLRDRMTGRPVPLADATVWISQLAGALDAAHEAGILHRDVKPANVLVGKGGRLFLADFGIAKMLETRSGLTATGMVVGTPLYMAPEQAQGKPATPATDRYALAVIAYELLAGAPPFEGESPLSLMHQHVAGAPPALSTKVRGLPGGLDAVFASALSKDPASRPPSCRALAESIGMFLPTGVAAAVPRSSPSAPPGVAARMVTTPPAGLTSEKTVFTGPARGRRGRAAGLAAGAAAAAFLAGVVLLRARREMRQPVAPVSPSPPGTAVAPTSGGDERKLAEPEARLRKAEGEIASRRQAASASALPPAPAPAAAPTPVPTAAGTAAPSDDLLAAALLRIDAIRRPTRRLSRDDFEFAREAARRVLGAQPENAEARTLDVYAGGGLDYVSGRDAEAGRALLDAFLLMKRLGQRKARQLAFFVRRPDGGFRVPSGWELALAYGDARGEAEGLLDAERTTSPGDPRVFVGLAGLRRLQGNEAGAREMLRSACRLGLAEACREAGADAPSRPLRQHAPGAR